MKLYNTLSRTIEEFEPIHSPHVGMYTCGPTVYDFAHIGNFRTYTTSDTLLRVLKNNKYDVTFVMNITDVGHLTGDNVGDADTGEDRMEKSAKKQGKSVLDIAEFYTHAFLKDFRRLNLLEPQLFAKATDHIQEQILFVKLLEQKGYTYRTSDGIYFDTSKFPDYGKLSSLDQIKEGARVEVNPEKKNPKDFALWKFSHPQVSSYSTPGVGEGRRQMEWESPWGIGFPGWHIECSAMSIKYLGESFDIHTGGVDLSSTHHPNEIAQAEAVTGKQFVKYWVHGAFILIDGKRMSKSLGNNYRVDDLIQKGFEPLSLRYLYLQTHYRQEMNFTFEALEGAQKALFDLWDLAQVFGQYEGKEIKDPSDEIITYVREFENAMNDDLNSPQALAILHEGLQNRKTDFDLLYLMKHTDAVLGLDFEKKGKELWAECERLNVTKSNLTPEEQEVLLLVEEREKLRKEKKFHLADQMRDKIKKLGYDISDRKGRGTEIRKMW